MSRNLTNFISFAVSLAFSGAPPVRGRAGRYLTIFMWSAMALAFAALVPAFGNKTLIGFDYRAVVDNSKTVCPDRVVSQSGNIITLATGQQLRVDAEPAALTVALAQADNYVKIWWKDDLLCMRRQSFSCGNRPQGDQIITIPLFATETTETHSVRDFAFFQRINPTSTGSANPR